VGDGVNEGLRLLLFPFFRDGGALGLVEVRILIEEKKRKKKEGRNNEEKRRRKRRKRRNRRYLDHCHHVGGEGAGFVRADHIDTA